VPESSNVSCHSHSQLPKSSPVTTKSSPIKNVNSLIYVTGIEGVLVDLKDTIRSFKAIMNGEGDDLPESAFYMSESSPLSVFIPKLLTGLGWATLMLLVRRVKRFLRNLRTKSRVERTLQFVS
jgi:hypothetical protein